MRIVYRLVLYSILFILVIMLEQYTDIDVWIQSMLYTPETHTWIITRAMHNGILGDIFYRGYKDMLIATGILAISYLIYCSVYRKKKGIRIALVKYLLALIIIPLVVALMKPITNVYCPTQLDIFDGFAPYVRLLHPYPVWFTEAHGRCFPAGHATSGFFFIITYYALQTTPYTRYKWIGFAIGIALGWITGFYQMARGEHFLSHTLATMVISCAIAWIIHISVDAIYVRKRYVVS